MLGHPLERVYPNIKYISVQNLSAWPTNRTEKNLSKIFSKFKKKKLDANVTVFMYYVIAQAFCEPQIVFNSKPGENSL